MGAEQEAGAADDTQQRRERVGTSAKRESLSMPSANLGSTPAGSRSFLAMRHKILCLRIRSHLDLRRTTLRWLACCTTVLCTLDSSNPLCAHSPQSSAPLCAPLTALLLSALLCSAQTASRRADAGGSSRLSSTSANALRSHRLVQRGGGGWGEGAARKERGLTHCALLLCSLCAKSWSADLQRVRRPHTARA